MRLHFGPSYLNFKNFEIPTKTLRYIQKNAIFQSAKIIHIVRIVGEACLTGLKPIL